MRKIPQGLLNKIDLIDSNDIVVACAKTIHKKDIRNGIYKHIELAVGHQGLVFPSAIIPNPMTGKYSEINSVGKEIVRNDLPMITKTYAIDTPNYGDWSYGSHTVYIDRDVYVREYVPPKLIEIKIELLGDNSPNLDEYIVRFTVDEVINRSDDDFLSTVIFNLNLLQENVGASDVYASSASTEEYVRTIHIDWEILPIGERDSDIAIFISKYRLKNTADVQTLSDRYDTLTKLGPRNFVSGASGFRRYFGAQFSDELVVFENIEYGNAIYVMYENWEHLSQKTRIELLTGDNQGFDRVVHTKNWKIQLKYLVDKALGRPIY